MPSGTLTHTLLLQLPVIRSPISDSEVFIAIPLTGPHVRDTVNVTDIKFENHGSCVTFLCSVFSVKDPKLFWVTGTL